MRPKSKSQQAEELHVAGEIAQAVSYAAHLRIGPKEKYTVRGLPSPEAAFDAADQLTHQYSRYGRHGIAYAINAKGRETLMTRDLVALSRSL